MTRKRGSAPSVKTSNISLIMESGTSPLSEIQVSEKCKAEEEYKQFMKKLNETIIKRNGEIIESGTHVTVYEIDCTPNFPAQVISKDITNVKSAQGSTILTTSQAGVQSLIPNQSVLLPSVSSNSSVFSGQPTYQLVVSPRMGLLVTPSSAGSVTTLAPGTNTNVVTSTLPTVRPITNPRVVRPGIAAINQPKRFPTSVGPGKIIINPATQRNISPITLQKAVSSSVPKTISSATTTKLVSTPVTSKIIPPKTAPPLPKTATPSVASTNTRTSPKSSSNAVVDLTDDDNKTIADSREMAINRYPGRIYPSLVVVARPQIKVKEMSSSTITAERTQLDTKVKGILTNSPTKFTEWLIQQGLVRSEQLCSVHTGPDDLPVRLKLGMYSDVSKFPHSGGYVWISECCPSKFVSVFCNSIFEGASYAPNVLLKLMYHWACQTNVHNIISWVKVDNLYIKNFFTNLRAVCTAAVCEKFGKMGGFNKKVEVGVISLGTTSQNGNVRQVKVEVLGVMDPVSKIIRLRAIEPVQNADKNHKLRFIKILEPLDNWVHKGTTIITDFTVDRATLHDMGFLSVTQVQMNAPESNNAIMEYLKRVVPRMFQNTLSLLSRSIIQQFLDELVWRERWGPVPSKAFDSLIAHTAELTKIETGDTLVNRLKGITANPFRDWTFKTLKAMAQTSQGSKKQEEIDNDGSNRAKVTHGRSKSVAPFMVGKAALTNKSAKPTSSASSDEASVTLQSANTLLSSITDLDDDSNSVSSSSSRRSRNRTSNEDIVLKPLEPYYYGVLPPDVVVVNKLRKVDLNMKCFVCGLTYNNNIQFMKHLAGHAQDEGAFTTDNQCRYCLKNFTSAYDLEDHLGSVHFPNRYNSMCLICSERFKNRGALITHMQDAHVELELPYNCTICKFRCSEHTKVVDHFYEVHDGGEKVQCPFCLKVVAFESSTKTKLTQNVSFFFNHIKRHQQKRKCPKCVLSFVNKTHLKEHVSKDHSSCIAIPGVIRSQASELMITLMPAPPATTPLSRKSKQSTLPIQKFSTYSLENTICYPDTPSSKCLECNYSDCASHHFASLFQCMKCTYATCCKWGMSSHMATMHEVKRSRKNYQRKTIPLPKPLYCVCGFSTSCGNDMASHLVHCKRRVAYPNAERAAQYSVQMQSASFPALVNLDDVEQDSNDASDKWLRAFVKNADSSHAEDKSKRPAISEKSPPRMLKELGLVRKESSSAETDDVHPKSSDTADDEMNNSGSTDIDTEPNKLTNGVGKRRFNESADDVELISSEDEVTEQSTDETKKKQPKLESTESVNRLLLPSAEELNEKATSVVEIEKVEDTVASAEQTKNVASEAESESRQSESISVASETAIKVDEQITKPSDDHLAIEKGSLPVNEEAAESTEIAPSLSDAAKESSIEAPKDVEVAPLLTDTVEKSSTEASKDAEVVPLLTDVAKESSTETVNKKVYESADMETEEPSPVNEKMDDIDEPSVAMECEDNGEESSMVVDTEPAQDAMVVD